MHLLSVLPTPREAMLHAVSSYVVGRYLLNHPKPSQISTLLFVADFVMMTVSSVIQEIARRSLQNCEATEEEVSEQKQIRRFYHLIILLIPIPLAWMAQIAIVQLHAQALSYCTCLGAISLASRCAVFVEGSIRYF